MRASLASSVRRLASLPSLSFLALLGAGAVVALTLSCQAPLEQKKGYQGDFCNGNNDHCQDGLVCRDGVCTSNNNAPDVCDTVCAKYAECSLGVGSCRPSCLKTLREWSEENTSRYETCHEQLQCSTLEGRDDPWNYCYQQLPPAPDSRLDVCDRFERKSRDCFSSGNIERDGRIDNMKGACKAEARTVGTTTWDKVEVCSEQNDCRTLFECANANFGLEGDDALPTSPGN